jgi:hypothetical protein
MIVEAINKILQLGTPNIQKFGDLSYSDKNLHIIAPPQPEPVCCSTLQGIVDLIAEKFDDLKTTDVFLQITSPTAVALIQNGQDDYGRLRVWAEANYPELTTFPFAKWLDPESFIIFAQQHFQRVKVENDDGSFAKDLDYVLQVASQITAENAVENADDGFAQRVAVKQGIALKQETILRPMIQLAPWRTFAEIDQVLSQFVFRARIEGGAAKLALFEGDGGRWKLGAVAAIKTWLDAQETKVPVIS